MFAGLGEVVTDFDKRSLPFDRQEEYASSSYYRTVLDAGGAGKVEAELASSEFLSASCLKTRLILGS